MISISRHAARSLAAPLLLALLVVTPRAGGDTAARGNMGPAGEAAVRAGGPEQSPDLAAAAIVRTWVDADRIPGAVLLVSRGGRVVVERAYGFARLFEYEGGEYGAAAAGESRPAALRRVATPTPMTTDTVFDLASVTKVMATTFAVMLLTDDGKLDLDAPVRTYLPDFTGGGKGTITLRHLLTHRSGLAQWQPIYYHAETADEAYAYIRALPLSWAAGDERHYSDLGFMILGLVVERVARQTLGELLRERLYGPLGLAATGFAPRPGGPIAATSHGNPFEHRMVHDPGFGYLYEGDAGSWNGWRRYTLAGEVNDGNAFHAFGGAAGHAGLFSTAAELHGLLRLLLQHGEHDGRRYLGAGLIDEFLAPTGDGQALGWQIPDYAPAGSFAHTGFTGTWVLGVPASDLAVVLLTNRQNAGLDDNGQYVDLAELQRAVARAAIGS